MTAFQNGKLAWLIEILGFQSNLVDIFLIINHLWVDALTNDQCTALEKWSFLQCGFSGLNERFFLLIAILFINFMS